MLTPALLPCRPRRATLTPTRLEGSPVRNPAKAQGKLWPPVAHEAPRPPSSTTATVDPLGGLEHSKCSPSSGSSHYCTLCWDVLSPTVTPNKPLLQCHLPSELSEATLFKVHAHRHRTLSYHPPHL